LADTSILIKRGGEAMSAFEIIMIIFVAMTFIVTFIKLVIGMFDMFSRKGK